MQKIQKEIERQKNYNNINQLLLKYESLLNYCKNDNKPIDKKIRKDMINEIINIINNDTSVLTIVDDNLRNIGMRSAILGLEPIVNVSLDDFNASIQQDYNGWNTGMFAAENKLEVASLKSLTNSVACLQQNIDGDNIAMISAKNCMKSVVTESLKNNLSSTQQNKDDDNVGMICATKSKLSPVTLIALQNPIASCQQNKHGDTIGLICAQQHFREGVLFAMENGKIRNHHNKKLLSMADYCKKDNFKEGYLKSKYLDATSALKVNYLGDPIIKNILSHNYSPNNDNSTIPMEKTKVDIEKLLSATKNYNLIKKMLNDYKQKSYSEQEACKDQFCEKIINIINENDTVLVLTDDINRNIGMHAAQFKLEPIVLRALDNPEACIQQRNDNKSNLAMHTLKYSLNEAMLKATKNLIANRQVDINGENFSMQLARKGYKDLIFETPVEDPIVRTQISNKGKSLVDYLHERSYKKQILCVEYLNARDEYFSYLEQSKNNENEISINSNNIEVITNTDSTADVNNLTKRELILMEIDKIIDSDDNSEVNLSKYDDSKVDTISEDCIM